MHEVQEPSRMCLNGDPAHTRREQSGSSLIKTQLDAFPYERRFQLRATVSRRDGCIQAVHQVLCDTVLPFFVRTAFSGASIILAQRSTVETKVALNANERPIPSAPSLHYLVRERPERPFHLFAEESSAKRW